MDIPLIGGTNRPNVLPETLVKAYTHTDFGFQNLDKNKGKFSIMLKCKPINFRRTQPI